MDHYFYVWKLSKKPIDGFLNAQVILTTKPFLITSLVTHNWHSFNISLVPTFLNRQVSTNSIQTKKQRTSNTSVFRVNTPDAFCLICLYSLFNTTHCLKSCILSGSLHHDYLRGQEHFSSFTLQNISKRFDKYLISGVSKSNGETRTEARFLLF